ncbi:MAG: hypothetical protein QOD41_3289 [Cryptosporangiaceae bacterium]|nr:hypothetical protein [Cryptosporangiaceae bacterium]
MTAETGGAVPRSVPRALLIVALAGLLAIAAVAAGRADAAHADGVPASADGVQIDVGGSGGGGFLADSYFQNGVADTNRSGSAGLPNFPRTVSHPIAQEQWNTFRFLESSYAIPDLTPGASYQLRLYFLDWYWSKAGQRIFDVAVNGAVVLKNFDAIQAAAQAGGDGRFIGVERDIDVTADATGTVHVDFVRGSADQPLVNAIVLAPPAP